MPREFIPQGRKRESRGKAELFPRTEAEVMTGPCRDRMLRGPAVDRHLTKAELHRLRMRSPAEAIEHIAD